MKIPSYTLDPGFRIDMKTLVKNEHVELFVKNEGFNHAAFPAKSMLDEAQ